MPTEKIVYKLMQENLVIVESPAKAKKIEEFLGKDYKVMSSYGHIRDLKKKELSINEKTMEPDYEIPEEKKKLVTELKTNAKKAKKIWLASDEDREGEAISWHLCEVLGLDEEKTNRIVFHEITKQAILDAIKNPRHLDMNLVNAQQARRVLDRLVGFKLSPKSCSYLCAISGESDAKSSSPSPTTRKVPATASYISPFSSRRARFRGNPMSLPSSL